MTRAVQPTRARTDLKETGRPWPCRRLAGLWSRSLPASFMPDPESPDHRTHCRRCGVCSRPDPRRRPGHPAHRTHWPVSHGLLAHHLTARAGPRHHQHTEPCSDQATCDQRSPKPVYRMSLLPQRYIPAWRGLSLVRVPVFVPVEVDLDEAGSIPVSSSGWRWR